MINLSSVEINNLFIILITFLILSCYPYYLNTSITIINVVSMVYLTLASFFYPVILHFWISI